MYFNDFSLGSHPAMACRLGNESSTESKTECWWLGTESKAWMITIEAKLMKMFQVMPLCI